MGKSQSCGCLNSERVSAALIKRNTSHGRSKDRIYKTWKSMIQRCYLPSYSGYENYGAKGVTVCDRWRHSFENFLADMGELPSKKHTIDRIENSVGYQPGNCRWATMKEQQNNRTNNVLLTFNGETMTIAQWSDRLGVGSSTIGARLRYGWSVERTLGTPLREGKYSGRS